MRAYMAALTHKIILGIALAAWLPSMAFALTPSQVYEQVKDSVVVVKAYDREGRQVGLGSGVVLPSGDIITTHSVVKAGVYFAVGRDKQTIPATLKASDADNDLCLLTAPGLVAEPAQLGRAARLKVGEPVYAVGASQALKLSLSEGIVSQLQSDGPQPIIQTTVAISPGFIGGGLFNATGELVGITTLHVKDGQSRNFALPVEWVAEVAGKKIRKRPKVEAGSPAPAAKPEATWIWSVGADSFRKAGDWPGMVAHCRRWTKDEPRNDFAWFCLGVAYGNLGHYDEEIKAYRKVVHIKPGCTDAWYNLTLAYAKSGNRNGALKALQELRRLDPQMADELFKRIMSP